jgi:hypothetical protein
MQFLIISTILLLWIAICTVGIVFIVCLVDGCSYGGPRFRDWRAPVLTIGGVLAFVAIMYAVLIVILQLLLP